MYKLYTDRPEEFACAIAVKNASLKNAMARIIVESDGGINLMFPGEINNGKCIVPIKKLKGLLQENSSGKIFLETIVEDTYFKPWQDNFIVEEHTSVKVQVNEQKSNSAKPLVSVVPIKPKELFEIMSVMKKFGINKSNFASNKRTDFKQIIKEYFRISKITNANRKTLLIKEVISSFK